MGSEMCIRDRDPTRQRSLPTAGEFEDLLVPIFRKGQSVYDPPSIHEARERTRSQLALCHSGIRRFVNPHQYPVGLEAELFELKSRLIRQARGLSADNIKNEHETS